MSKTTQSPGRNGNVIRNRGLSPTTERLLPVLGRIVDTFSEGATAGIDDGDATLFVAHVAPVAAVHVADVTGDRWPPHTTASGIVLMTGWNDDRLDSYLAGDLEWSAPNTITDPTQLCSRVDEARVNGYAWSVEELVNDAAGLAVPPSRLTGQDRRSSRPLRPDLPTPPRTPPSRRPPPSTHRPRGPSPATLTDHGRHAEGVRPHRCRQPGS